MHYTSLIGMLLALLLLAGCAKGSGMQATTIERATTFIGEPLPEGASSVRAVDEAGADRLVLLSFESEEAAARAWATRLLGAPPRIGVDPGLGYLGEGVAWWPKAPPPRAEGGEARRSDNRVLKLLLAPATGQPTRVFVAAFSQ